MVVPSDGRRLSINPVRMSSVSANICLFEDDQFDFILCGAVMEHTRRPWDVAREMCRVLKPGGTVRVDWPFISAVHGYPSHYFNATPEGVISLFERYCDVEYSVVASKTIPFKDFGGYSAYGKTG